MTKVGEESNWICTINVENKQDCFAQCLQLILWLEEIHRIGQKTKESQFSEFYISRASEKGINDVDEMLKLEEYIDSGENRKFKKIVSEEALLNGLNKESGTPVFNYYLRVKLNNQKSDITELQYLVLLLQSIPNISERIAIRLMGDANVTWGTTDFFRVSQFLRFIQHTYKCFYSCYDHNLESLRKLMLKSEGTLSTFLPLLEVDSELCQELNKTWFLDMNYQGQPYNKIYTVIGPMGCHKNSRIYSLFEIAFRILFKSLPGRKYSRQDAKKELLNLVCNIVKDVQGVTVLDMLLFGALVCTTGKRDLEYDVAIKLLEKIQTLSLSVGQVLENIVNHSEKGKGVFTFRIQKNKHYMSEHYPDYIFDEEKTCVELLIADSNRRDGIVKHFINSNKADNKLKEIAHNIYLEDLFGDHRNQAMNELFQLVRKDKPEMCHGLITFSNGIKAFSGAVRVRSMPCFISHDYKDVYYHNGVNKKYEAEKIYEGAYIPGTQFAIALNRISLENDVYDYDENKEWAFDFDKLVYTTTYRELAQALVFSQKVHNLDIDAEVKKCHKNFCSQEEKDRAVEQWKNWFNSKNPEVKRNTYHVYQCDLKAFCEYLDKHPELGEPFCKGLLSSNFFVETNKNKYSCILVLNSTPKFSRIFKNTLLAFDESVFDLQNTSVYFYLKSNKEKDLPYYATTLHTLLSKPINTEVFPDVFPYTLFVKGTNEYTLFEEELLKQACVSIYDNQKQGYKICNTHMRLGNKVHLDTFYEMSLFFENPNYAYYTAFLFLRSFLKDKKKIISQKKKLLLFGYASYSRAIIWAIIQILKEYNEIRKNKFPEIAFVIYQNDLKLESEQSQIQMYYSKEEWQRDHTTIWSPEETTLALIVPISSSLTTFNKMEAELYNATNKRFCSDENFTAFWVRNEYKNKCEPSGEEKFFWKKVNIQKRLVTSYFVKNEIRYLVSVTSKWEDPLLCSKCFPKDPLFEYPLVETDPTSTVPTQQFYRDMDNMQFSVLLNTDDKENDLRVSRLKGNIVYGHVSKGSNHFQHYIKTRVYFQQERAEIAQWLRKLRANDEDIDQINRRFSKCVDILVIPQQSNNVEFGQYVYEYYFKGCAECIIINTEKEFRSNLEAEYSALFNRLKAVENPRENIRFHYVDVSVNSGSSYNRALSLLSSCMEGAGLSSSRKHSKYEFRFTKVFLMISRLSQASKLLYVQEPRENFHAYVEIHISAMRNFGDSCVPCKLQEEAKNYYKKAATKSISSYWEDKSFARECIPFDQLDEKERDLVSEDEGYRRMMCSHRAEYYVRQARGHKVNAYFLAIRTFLDEIRIATDKQKICSPVYNDISEENQVEWLAAALKIIARPFFSYDYKMRCAVMDLYLILSEHLIGDYSVGDLEKRIMDSQDRSKDYLLQDDNIEWAVAFADDLVNNIRSDDKFCKLRFVRDNILKSLADIKSNYIMRKTTMLHMGRKLDKVECKKDKDVAKFYEHLLRSILRLTHSSSDETKGVWLEYLLQHGEEYSENCIDETKNQGIDKLVSSLSVNVQKEFRSFLEVLLVENNRPIYQAVIECDKKIKLKAQEQDEPQVSLQIIEELTSEYHMRNAVKFFSEQCDEDVASKLLQALRALLVRLDEKHHDISGYHSLGESIQEIVKLVTVTDENVILYGKCLENRGTIIKKYLDLPSYFSLYPEDANDTLRREKSEQQQNIEAQWKKIEDDSSANNALGNHGFCLLENNSEKELYNIVIMLDNNYDKLSTSKRLHSHQKIEPIYIYMCCKLERQKALNLTRMILMFRCKLVEWLENDFNNNAIAVLSQQQHLAELLSTDKMGDHADDDFVDCQQNVLMMVESNEFCKENWEYVISEDGENLVQYYDCNEVALHEKIYCSGVGSVTAQVREWFLLRAYINSRIARLFRTMIRVGNSVNDKEFPINMERYYSTLGTSVRNQFIADMQNIFFGPINIGYIRKNYIKQMLKVITFTVQGVHDYKGKPKTKLAKRMRTFSQMIKAFRFISFEINGQKYGYRAEYLAIILLDCFISALKAGEDWNLSQWGGEAFYKLNRKGAADKCEVKIYRKRGEEYFDKAYDYLVIENEIQGPLRNTAKGVGMSQAASRWYIESIWQYFSGEKEGYPEVLIDPTEDKYVISLPILEREGE